MSIEKSSYYRVKYEGETSGKRALGAINPRKRKEALTPCGQSSRQPNPGKNNSSGNSLSFFKDMLRDFMQEQERIDKSWRESLERHAYERQRIEEEWRQSMVKLQSERMMAERVWREKEEQRKAIDDSRAERRDALLTMLLEKLHRDNP